MPCTIFLKEIINKLIHPAGKIIVFLHRITIDSNMDKVREVQQFEFTVKVYFLFGDW